MERRTDTFEELQETVRNHDQTIYGAEGNNGMYKAVQQHTKMLWISTGALSAVGIKAVIEGVHWFLSLPK